MEMERREFFFESKHDKSVSILIENIKKMNVPSLIEVAHTGYATGIITLRVRYYVCKSKGYFINFCGFLYNTETGYIVLGYNANNDYYIPICSIVDFINASINLSSLDLYNKTFNLKDINYMVESMKINPKEFNYSSFLEDCLGEFNNSIISDSLIRNFIVKESYKKDILRERFKEGIAQDSYEFYECLRMSYNLLNRDMSMLCGIFLGSCDLEVSQAEVNKKISKKSHVLGNMMGIESCFIHLIRDIGMKEHLLFVKELSTLCTGNKARKTLFSASVDSELVVKMLSSFYYLRVDKDFDRVDSSVVDAYNFINIFRGVNRELDLYFSIDMFYTINNSNLLRGLIARLGLQKELEVIGLEKFAEICVDYFRHVSHYIDSTGYNLTVSSSQKSFISINNRVFVGGGKLVSKASERILRLFE